MRPIVLFRVFWMLKERKHLLSYIKVAIVHLLLSTTSRNWQRKCDSVSSVDEPPARIRRSQVSKFDFKTHCLFCGKDCEPVNSKHPDRWYSVKKKAFQVLHHLSKLY